MKLVRGHYYRLLRRGSPRDDALSDSCYLIAFATWLNLGSVFLLTNLPLPSDRLMLSGLALGSLGMVYWILKKLIALWIDDLESITQDSADKYRFSDNAASWVHFFGSIVIFIASLVMSDSLQ